MNTYSLKDVKLAIDQLSLKKKDIIYVSGNLINFGKIELKSLDNLPKTFFSCLLRKVGKEGTIVFPTHSFYLVNSKKIFDANNTLSNSGAFSNYLIKKKKYTAKYILMLQYLQLEQKQNIFVIISIMMFMAMVVLGKN